MKRLVRSTLLLGLFLFCGFVAPASFVQAGLLVNGDFEAGNTGFQTEYDYISTVQMLWPDDYAIVSNPAPYNSEAYSFGDHTTGTGLMMLVDSAWNLNDLVWGQTVSVAANETYTFSGWIASPFVAEPKYMSAYLQIKINDQLVGSVYGPSPSGVWNNFQFSWDSLTATMAKIEIFERGDIGHPGRLGGGNDFALDDLSFVGPAPSVVPEPTSLAIFGIGALGMAGFRRRKQKQTA